MRRLLKDFDELFDLTYQVGDRPLGEWLEQMISGLEKPSQEWGTTGARGEIRSEQGRLVSFYDRRRPSAVHLEKVFDER